MANKAQLQIVVDAVDNASKQLKTISGETENLEKKTSGLSSALQTAGAAISAYAGVKGLMSLINESEESSKQLAQARFYMGKFGEDTDGTFKKLVDFGKQMQSTIGASDEYSTMVAAKLLPRVKDLNKSKEYAAILLRGERLGVLNANDAANMMMRATEGNERAMRMLLEQYGLSVPKFAGMSTMMEELSRKLKEGEKELTPYGQALAILGERFAEFKEKAGTPLANILATIFGWVNNLLDRFPILGNIISIAMVTITSLLALAGIQILVNFITPLMTGIKALGLAFLPLLANPMVWAIGLMIAAIILWIVKWEEIKGGLMVVWDAIKYTWNATVDYLSDKMLAGYDYMKTLWDGFGTWWKDLWQGIQNVISSAVDWINKKIQALMSPLSSIASGLKAVGSSVGSKVNSAISAVSNYVSGARANGGPVSGGSTYLVGERGPELFTPMSSGNIIPNGGMGGSVVINMSGTFLDRNVAVQIGDEIINRFKEIYRIGS